MIEFSCQANIVHDLFIIYLFASNVFLKAPKMWLIRSVISKGSKFRFPAHIYFKRCRETIVSALNDYCTRWCKREHVESNALNYWKLKIFKIIDERVLFYSNNLDLLPPNPKLSFGYLKQGIQEFHRKYVLAPADKAANNLVVV